MDENHTPTIDSLIADAICAIDLLPDPASEEYTTAVKNLETLYRLSDGRKAAPRPKIDPNILISGCFSAASLWSIVNAERVGVIASKAVSFVPKVRLF